jgi:hypothetical protein
MERMPCMHIRWIRFICNLQCWDEVPHHFTCIGETDDKKQPDNISAIALQSIMFIFRFYQVGAPSLRASYYTVWFILQEHENRKNWTLFSFPIYFTEPKSNHHHTQYIFITVVVTQTQSAWWWLRCWHCWICMMIAMSDFCLTFYEWALFLLLFNWLY